MPDEFGRFFEFPPFRFDLADKILTSDGQTIALPTRAAEILAHLIQNRDRLVSRKELREKFWSDLYVADNTIDRQVSEIRRALRSQPNSDHHIETQSKKGWRLVVDVAAAGQPSRKRNRRDAGHEPKTEMELALADGRRGLGSDDRRG